MSPDGVDATGIILRRLVALNELTIAAVETDSHTRLIFMILNDTIRLAGYDRALLWSLTSATPELLGISGQAEVNTKTAVAEEWVRLVHAELRSRQEPVVITRDDCLKHGEVSAQAVNGTLLWLPLKVQGVVVAGLWLERSGPWGEDEVQLLQRLCRGYAAHWLPRSSIRKRLTAFFSGWRARAAIAAGLVFFFLIPVRLRVVAPCEVIHNNPFSVCAPLSGVIRQIKVKPGERVGAGGLLFEYDAEIQRERVAALRKEVGITRSRYERIRVESLEKESAKKELRELDYQLRSEKVRLALAESQEAKLRVRATVAGTVIMDDPNRWHGRSVHTGDPIMMLVDPESTLVRIWVQENDNVGFDESVPVKILLNAASAESLRTAIRYESPIVSMSPDGVSAFVMEAEWRPGSSARPGLKGSAILYGQHVCIAYWLLRRPLAAARRLFGI